MPAPVAIVAAAAVTVGGLTALRTVRRIMARGERRLATAHEEAEVYDLEHDAETDTYRARRLR